MEELLKKIIEITQEMTVLRMENKKLKEEVNRLREMNSYLNHKVGW